MAINALINFGVPSISGVRAPQLAPVFSNRFRVTFYGFGPAGAIAPYDLTNQVKTIAAPTVSWETSTLASYVSLIYVVNRGEWGEMELTFYDDITNGVTTLVEAQKSKQQNFFDQTLSRAGENYKFEMDLDYLAGGARAGARTDPNIIRKWSYRGVMLTKVDYGQLNYEENNKVQDVTCSLRFDNVVGFDQNGNIFDDYNDTAEIAGQIGTFATGVGSSLVNIGGASIRVIGASLAGGATVGGGGGLTF